MLILLATAILAQGQDPIVPIARPGLDGRGRDPWVFRGIFEDRTRMLVIAPRPNWWMVFNPETCAMHKVWQGKMDFRGKVWDFSQDNSRAEGKIYFAAPNEIWRFPNTGQMLPGWTAKGITADTQGWVFSSADSELSSPTTNLSDWHRVFVAFDETGKRGRFRLDISGPQPQWFTSATSVGGENDWQWNFKRIERPARDTSVRITTHIAGNKLRNLRLYGDKQAWFDGKGLALEVHFDGYRLVHRTQAVDILYRVRLASGKWVSITHRPEVRLGRWQEDLRIDGLPKGEKLILRREGVSGAVRTTLVDGAWTFSENGDYPLAFQILEVDL